MFLICCFLLLSAGCYGADEVLPNIGFLLRGYHLYHGNPLATQVTSDPGFQSQIFEPQYFENLLSSDLKYRIPDGTKAYSKEGCTQAFSNDVIETPDEYQRMLKEMVKTNYTGFEHTFRGSSDYKKVHNTHVLDKKSHVLLTQYLCVKYEAVLNPASPPPLSSAFVDQIREIYIENQRNKTDINLAVHMFLNMFGTHYVSSIDMGSRYSHQSKVNSRNRHELEQVGMDMKTGAILSMTRKMGHTLTEREIQRAMLYEAIVEDTNSASSFSHNDDGTLNIGVSKPQPLFYEIKRIDELFVKKYLKSAGVDYKRLKLLIEQYFMNYCKNEKKYSGEERCDETQYGNSVIGAVSQKNFKVVFPDKGSPLNSVLWRQKLNSMNSVTLSWWMKTPPYTMENSKLRRVVLAYSGSNNGYSTDYLKITVSTEQEGGCLSVMLDGEEVQNGNINFCLIPVDNTYHHYVFTWSSTFGRWQLYVDGNVMSGGTHGRKYVIPAGGYLVLGQAHNAGSIKSSTKSAFVGEIAFLNVWNFFVNGVEARKLATDNGFIEGNIASWDQAKLKFNGDSLINKAVTTNDEFFKA